MLALLDIDRTIAQLRRQRQDDLAAMTREVQSAASLVAAQHGCRLTFTAGQGNESHHGCSSLVARVLAG